MDGFKHKHLFIQKSFIHRHRAGIVTLMINLHLLGMKFARNAEVGGGQAHRQPGRERFVIQETSGFCV